MNNYTEQLENATERMPGPQFMMKSDRQKIHPMIYSKNTKMEGILTEEVKESDKTINIQ